MKRGVVIVGLIAALVRSVAGIAVAVLGWTHADSRANGLRRAVTALRAELGQVKTEASQLQNQAGQMDLTSLVGRVHKLEQCVPQIQAQIDGMNVNSGYYDNPPGINGQVVAYPVTLQNSTLISQDCQAVLRPSH